MTQTDIGKLACELHLKQSALQKLIWAFLEYEGGPDTDWAITHFTPAAYEICTEMRPLIEQLERAA